MKKIILSFTTLLFLFSLCFMACNDKTATEKAIDDLEETGDDVGDIFRTEQEELRHDIKEAQEELSERMENIREDMKDATGDAKEEMNEQLSKLEAQSNELGEDLDRLGDQIADGWKDFRMNVKQSIDEIKADLDDEM